MSLLQDIQSAEIKALGQTPPPAFAPGDTLKVNVRVTEGKRERLQAFEGVCIARGGKSIGESFTLRKISHGVGVERVFPLYSPIVESITLLRQGRVRRAKLYYLRGLQGRAARIPERVDYKALAKEPSKQGVKKKTAKPKINASQKNASKISAAKKRAAKSTKKTKTTAKQLKAKK